MTASLAGLAWGLAEATLFFIVPDVLLGWEALRHGPARALGASVAATAGATLGGALVHRNAEAMGPLIARTPGISPALVDAAADEVRLGGWGAILRGPLGGIPYKVYALEAARQGLPLSGLVAVTPLARFWRFALVALGVSALPVPRASVRVRPWPWLLAYATVWCAAYAAYFRTIARRYPR